MLMRAPPMWNIGKASTVDKGNCGIFTGNWNYAIGITVEVRPAAVTLGTGIRQSGGYSLIWSRSTAVFINVRW